jgi:hypothetical protein
LCCERRSSFSMCSSVVLPALSSPKKRILAFLCARPNELRTEKNQSTRNISEKQVRHGTV